jgi:DNA-binding PadR family transcriptional regulator
VKQHLTDSGVEALQERVSILEQANDLLREARHHLNVQLDEAKARALQVETLLARQVDFREAEKAYADARLDELHSSVR